MLDNPVFSLFSNLHQLRYSIFTVKGDVAYPKQYGLQDPATKYFEDIIDLHHDLMMFIIMGTVFVLYMLLSTFYLYADNQSLTPSQDIRHNTFIEVVWTMTPAFILFTIAVPSFILLYSMEENFEASVNLKVFGNQWYWTYECEDLVVALPKKTTDLTPYADYLIGQNSRMSTLAQRELLSKYLSFVEFKDSRIFFDAVMFSDREVLSFKGAAVRLLSTDNVLLLPARIPIRCTVTSSDVIHSWTVPSFGVKLDGCPGRLNSALFTVKRTGTYYGQCSEICGVKHAFMPIHVTVVRAKKFLNYALHTVNFS